MEPLAALGLASNVLQFIDFSSNLVRDASNIYHSTSGLTAELEDVTVITNSLKSYMSRLSPPALSPSAPPEDRALETLVLNCHKTCGELKDTVEKIKGKDPSSRRDSFRAAWRSLRTKGKLEGLGKRLGRYQSQILGQLVSMLRDENQENYARLESQRSKDKVHVMEMKQDLCEIRERLLSLVHSQADDNRAVPVKGASVSYEDILKDIRVALLDISERMTTISAERKISDLLWFPELRLRSSLVVKAHRGTYRWLLYDPDDDFGQGSDIQTSSPSLSPSSSFYKPEQASVISQQSNVRPPEVESSNRIDVNSDQCSTTNFQSQKEKLQRQVWRGHFLDWLQTGNGLFYISGKPGSGKSTLLKYISQDPLTQQLLEAWANTDAKDIILVQFFFWSSGTKEQKTTEGLYRSILWEVLQSRPDLTQQIFPNLWRRALEGSIHESDLTKQSLQVAFQKLVSGQEILSKHKLCFFIDGLDECEEDHWHLTKELKRWCAASDVKLCVSSRPHNEFLRAFAPENGYWLKLHELTQEDILKVVNDQFASDERFVEAQKMSKDSSDYDKLTDSIIGKADGVFIWVIMVIRSLLHGIGNCCSLTQLRKRLDAVPAEIDSMFRYMLYGIDQLEQQAAARTFLVMEIGAFSYNPTAWVYTHAVLDNLVDDPEHEESLLDGKLQPSPEGRYGTSICAVMANRLNGRCRGLVNIAVTGRNFPLCHQVQFVHRTFSDFLRGPETVQNLKKMAGDFLPHRGVALGLLAARKHVPEQQWVFQCQGHRSVDNHDDENDWHRREAFFGMLDVAAHAEMIGNHHLTAEIESMKQMTFPISSFDSWQLAEGISWGPIVWRIEASMPNELDAASLCLAARYGAFEYVKSTVHKHNLDAEVSSLILWAASPQASYLHKKPEAMNQAALIRFLLERSASPNFEIRSIVSLEVEENYLYSPSWTPWTSFLMGIAERGTTRRNIRGLEWRPFLDLYLEYGSDMTVCFVGYKLLGTRKTAPWSENGHNQIFESEENEILKSAQGPVYVDLPTMLQMWDLGMASPGLTKNKFASRGLLSSWVSAFTPGREKFPKLGLDDIQRWTFLVLKVVSLRRLRDLERSDLEDALRQMVDAGTEHWQNNHMIQYY